MSPGCWNALTWLPVDVILGSGRDPNNAIFVSNYRGKVMGPFHNNAWLCALSANSACACRSRMPIDNCSWQAPRHLFDLHSRVDIPLWIAWNMCTVHQPESHRKYVQFNFRLGHSTPMTRALHPPEVATWTVVRPIISCISLFVSSKSPMFPWSVIVNQGRKLVMHLQMKTEDAAWIGCSTLHACCHSTQCGLNVYLCPR